MGNIQGQLTKQALARYTTMMNSEIQNLANTLHKNQTAKKFDMAPGKGGCYFDVVNGNVNMKSEAQSKISLNAQNVDQINKNLGKLVKNTTGKFIQQELASDPRGWFAKAFASKVSGIQNTNDLMNQLLGKTDITVDDLCKNLINTYNRGMVNLCGVYDAQSFDFNQDAFVTALGSCINSFMMHRWTTDSTLDKLWQETDKQLAGNVNGGGSAAGGMFGGLASMFGGGVNGGVNGGATAQNVADAAAQQSKSNTTFWIIIAIIVIILVILLIYAMTRKSTTTAVVTTKTAPMTTYPMGSVPLSQPRSSLYGV